MRTRDHSAVQLLMDLGEIDESQMATHPAQNRLYRCLGGRRIAQTRHGSLAIQPATCWRCARMVSGIRDRNRTLDHHPNQRPAAAARMLAEQAGAGARRGRYATWCCFARPWRRRRPARLAAMAAGGIRLPVQHLAPPRIHLPQPRPHRHRPASKPMTEESNALPIGYSLHRYQIEGRSGRWRFRHYLQGNPRALQNEVAIKEYFRRSGPTRPQRTTVRANAQGSDPRQSMASPLLRLGPAAVPRRSQDSGCRSIIRRRAGAGLLHRQRQRLHRHGVRGRRSLSATLQRGGILPEPELRRLLHDVLPALEAVHAQGYLHRDLKAQQSVPAQP